MKRIGRIHVGKLLGELGDEIGVDLHGREDLPGLQHGAPAERGQVGEADEHPFRPRSNVDELGALVLVEEFPGFGRFQIACV